MLKRALKRRRPIPSRAFSASLEAANAQTGIETNILFGVIYYRCLHRLEAANAQTGIETPLRASACPELIAVLEAANAQTGIETNGNLLSEALLHVELEAANAQTGIETNQKRPTSPRGPAKIRSSECSNGH